MVHYRLYFFTGVGHIGAMEEIEAADDPSAIAAAALRQQMGAMELWSGMRKVKRWEPLAFNHVSSRADNKSGPNRGSAAPLRL